LIWTYLTLRCDIAGLWPIDMPTLRTQLGVKISLQKFLEEANKDHDKLTEEEVVRERVLVVCDGKKLWITGSLAFQWGNAAGFVNLENPAVRNAIKILKAFNLYDVAIDKEFIKIDEGVRGGPRGSKPVEEETEEVHIQETVSNEKEIKKEKEENKKDIRRFIVPTLEEIKQYCEERKNNIDPEQFFDHYEARGWVPKGYTRQMKDWKAAIRTWERNGNGKDKSKSGIRPLSKQEEYENTCGGQQQDELDEELMGHFRR
ncbi:MAG: hypothetical protein WC530_10500, partial [Candidatus Omnitrophota bacterium]